MLARDVMPSRFERSRIVLRDLIDRLEGNRIGLVAFSGSTAILLPLTLDTDAARLFAEQLQVPSVDAPGTSIDRAVDRSIEMFEAAGEGDRVLVVISDGEDLANDPLPLATGAAERAREAGVSVVTVAVGTQAGAEIPLDVMGSDTLKRGPSGEPVRTRARPDVMAALSTDGLAVDATTGDEADRVAMWVGGRGHTEHAAAGRTIRRELFQLPLVAAFALLCIDALLGSWRGR
jgi:Ca-activated chloride channel family protein